MNKQMRRQGVDYGGAQTLSHPRQPAQLDDVLALCQSGNGNALLNLGASLEAQNKPKSHKPRISARLLPMPGMKSALRVQGPPHELHEGKPGLLDQLGRL